MTATSPFVLLDNNLDDETPSYLFEKPSRILQAERVEDVDSVLADLDVALADGYCAAGFLSYEAGYALEPRLKPLLPERRKVPLIWFGLFSSYRQMARAEAAAWLKARTHGDYALTASRYTWDKETYAKAFRRLKEYIAAGDIYQLNLTFGRESDLLGDPFAFYRDLRRRQPVAHGAFIETEDFKIFSLSPELFFRCDGEDIETRPMKGTASREASPEADQFAAQSLARDEKSQAENLMIVDLMRNDLGRIAKPGSVSVPTLFHVESYPTLHQMVSVVKAKRAGDATPAVLLRALFPPGSITGAPKIRAVEIGRELERGPRGVYTGVIGAFFPHDKALFNVAIRTLFARPSGNAVHCSMGIGGGIVQDSALDTEYEECLLKSAFLNDDERDFRLFETLRYASDNGFYLLKQHLGRMRVSAHALGFLFDESAASNALNNAVAGTKTDYLRVKLLLSKTGEWETIQSAFPSELIGKPLSFVLADQSVDSRNPLLLHKTTRRALFDEAFADMQRKTACDEILFLNERGELTQGSYTNLFIRLRKGEPWLTPPLSSGLLPGTLRSFLLESGEAEERTLHPPDLENAEVVCLGNALRGLVKGIIPK